jgi:hypothetical protein
VLEIAGEADNAATLPRAIGQKPQKSMVVQEQGIFPLESGI